jgi:hypothetical protein
MNRTSASFLLKSIQKNLKRIETVKYLLHLDCIYISTKPIFTLKNMPS